MREALRFRAYRSALLSNFATGWSAFGLRVALVPLFVSDVMHRGVGMSGVVLAAFAAGNALAVIPSGYLSDRMGRRTLLIVGLTASGVATVGWAPCRRCRRSWSRRVWSVRRRASICHRCRRLSPTFWAARRAAGTPVAAVQMMSDLGAIVGSMTVGWVAEQLSFGWGFAISGVILLIAAVGLGAVARNAANARSGAGCRWPSQADVELA